MRASAFPNLLHTASCTPSVQSSTSLGLKKEYLAVQTLAPLWCAVIFVFSDSSSFLSHTKPLPHANRGSKRTSQVSDSVGRTYSTFSQQDQAPRKRGYHHGSAWLFWLQNVCSFPCQNENYNQDSSSESSERGLLFVTQLPALTQPNTSE